MPTRNIYVKIAKHLQGKEGFIKKSLISIWLGGFILMAILSQIHSTSGVILDVVAKLVLTGCILLGVILFAIQTFNPERDPNDISPNESWIVFNLNIAIIFIIWFLFKTS